MKCEKDLHKCTWKWTILFCSKARPIFFRIFSQSAQMHNFDALHFDMISPILFWNSKQFIGFRTSVLFLITIYIDTAARGVLEHFDQKSEFPGDIYFRHLCSEKMKNKFQKLNVVLKLNYDINKLNHNISCVCLCVCMHICCVWAISSSIQGSLLVLHSLIISSSAQGNIWETRNINQNNSV